jgi:hypothetical protein
MRARPLLAASLLTASALATSGCHLVGPLVGQRISDATGGSRPARTSPTTRKASPRVASLKPVVSGFIDRQGRLADDWAGIVRGVVVNVDWATVQPTAGGSVVGATIDRALADVRRFNSRHPATPVAIKLRVDAGIHAPGWLKARVGTAYVQNPVGSGAGDVPFWWQPVVEEAYRELMVKLAARYDDAAEIREVQISQCSLIYPEPLIRMRSQAAALATFRAHGLTRAADLACLRSAVDAHAAWHRTRSAIALNPYQDPDGKGTDVSATMQIAAYCRRVLGPRCVLENHSIRATSQGDDYERMYAGMKAMGRPLALQTATPAKIGSLDITLTKALALGAEAVELPFDYRSWPPTSFRTTFHSALSALDARAS